MKWFHQWRLNRALRRHAKWKARAEAEAKIYDGLRHHNSFHASNYTGAKAREAYWSEAVEQIMREKHTIKTHE